MGSAVGKTVPGVKARLNVRLASVRIALCPRRGRGHSVRRRTSRNLINPTK